MSINLERLKELRDKIATLPMGYSTIKDGVLRGKFSMDRYHMCGTPCCLAGWAVELFYKEGLKGLARDRNCSNPHSSLCDEIELTNSIPMVAQTLLGLNYTQAANLFMGKFATGGLESLNNISPKQAVDFIDAVLENPKILGCVSSVNRYAERQQ